MRWLIAVAVAGFLALAACGGKDPCEKVECTAGRFCNSKGLCEADAGP